jgi:hypothetical protein
VTERIVKSALPVRPPRRLMVPHGIEGAVRTRLYGPLDVAVGVVSEDLNSHGGRAYRCGTVEPVVRWLVQKEGRSRDLQAGNRAMDPENDQTSPRRL